jgi:eukaryotic-like serine/threonine-protein kinase
MWVPDAVLEHVREVADLPDLSATKYRMIGPLGRGGMGAVYAVEDVELGREVALKVSFAAPASSEACARLRREARILALLEHPGIVPVHDVGTLPDDRVYYVMKRVRGERLDAWADKNPDPRARLRIFVRICEAVAFAHAEGVIHRDLKPENVMVGEFGEALVMDWGIARELASAEAAGVEGAEGAGADDAGETLEGAVLGTRAYMAPEQARGERSLVGPRADVFALGAVLRFLAGSPLPKPLASICTKAMAPLPVDRYATASELAADVGRFVDRERVLAHPDGALDRIGRFAARNAVVLSLLAAYLLLRVLLLALAR